MQRDQDAFGRATIPQIDIPAEPSLQRHQIRIAGRAREREPLPSRPTTPSVEQSGSGREPGTGCDPSRRRRSTYSPRSQGLPHRTTIPPGTYRHRKKRTVLDDFLRRRPTLPERGHRLRDQERTPVFQTLFEYPLTAGDHPLPGFLPFPPRQTHIHESRRLSPREETT